MKIQAIHMSEQNLFDIGFVEKINIDGAKYYEYYVSGMNLFGWYDIDGHINVSVDDTYLTYTDIDDVYDLIKIFQKGGNTT